MAPFSSFRTTRRAEVESTASFSSALNSKGVAGHEAVIHGSCGDDDLGSPGPATTCRSVGLHTNTCRVSSPLCITRPFCAFATDVLGESAAVPTPYAAEMNRANQAARNMAADFM